MLQSADCNVESAQHGIDTAALHTRVATKAIREVMSPLDGGGLKNPSFSGLSGRSAEI
jgi:hypothetical protein